ncbi:kinesin-like protein KIN-12A isoform X4 [Vicia villosa]|nr:kinesin-like protein KIN-12A isoform X4 [Vicia villosa]XP_058754937.1 kinesin-like protein KIN-12A isoform X4 [Vicia villosa]XP_058754938.1 kinesin-like protein KIN-12A isoform X4 [Vicia villosa]XP_058754939.1 kinesin-like protein KIN-12A isoform X4 [Vicia villosa]XP_058754940.1 kinesin-like protein KIN-12A isoform X4 [Vicia villosa]
MWGPANSLAEAKEQQELTPRVFERLFPRIKEEQTKEQTKHSDQQFNYQCNCSFLEIYNEQITYLLDPSQRNLQIREDVKSSVYVENLTENQVSTMEDVTQLLLKVHRCDQYRKNTVVGILQAEHVVNILLSRSVFGDYRFRGVVKYPYLFWGFEVIFCWMLVVYQW